MEEFRSGFLTIIGRPNVGKSTLLNNIIGTKVSIVTPKPQTTRDNVKAIFTADKMQLVFIDTPGLHKGRDLLGKRMSRNVADAIEGVDLALLLVDVSKEMNAQDKFVIKWLTSNVGSENRKVKVFLLLNKIDIVEKSKLLQIIETYKNMFTFDEIIPISALKKENFSLLFDEIYKVLKPGPAYYPPEQTREQDEDFIVSELIREKILLFTHEEVPYSVAVRVEEMTERENDVLYISAAIYVEKDSQKGILIGKKASMLKKIGERARKDIETALSKKVFLDLTVKVKEGWRSRENILKQWGY